MKQIDLNSSPTKANNHSKLVLLLHGLLTYHTSPTSPTSNGISISTRLSSTPSSSPSPSPSPSPPLPPCLRATALIN